MSTQVVWRQRHDSDASATMEQAVARLRCMVSELPSQQWDRETSTIGGIRDFRCSYFAPASPEWSSVRLHHNALIGKQLAAELSRLIHGPSILFSEYDQVAWGYQLFIDGAEADVFWNNPGLVGENADEVAGKASVLSEAFGVSESVVAPYLRPVSSETPPTLKAYPDDEHPLRNHWVRVDFMRRLGFDYPGPGTEGGRHLRIIEPLSAQGWKGWLQKRKVI